MTTEGTLRLLWHPPPPEGSDACARMKIMAFVYRDTRRCMCSRKSCAHSPFKRIIRKIHKQFVHTGTGACSHTRTLCWDLHHDTRKRAARPPPVRTTDKCAQIPIHRHAQQVFRSCKHIRGSSAHALPGEGAGHPQ
jgi:hypothetical protein